MTYIYDPNQKPQEFTTEAPEEDSPDLTDEEIAQSVPTENLVDFARIWRTQFLVCDCGALRQPIKSVLRRRKPNLYSRMHTKCTHGHEHTKTFVVNWMV